MRAGCEDAAASATATLKHGPHVRPPWRVGCPARGKAASVPVVSATDFPMNMAKPLHPVNAGRRWPAFPAAALVVFAALQGGMDRYLPHGVCYAWQPGLIRLHLVSDVLIGLAYLAIPVALVHFIRSACRHSVQLDVPAVRPVHRRVRRDALDGSVDALEPVVLGRGRGEGDHGRGFRIRPRSCSSC